MLQFLLNIMRHLDAPCVLSETERWRVDPLSHPVLRAMNERELGDLPAAHPVLPRRLVEGGC